MRLSSASRTKKLQDFLKLSFFFPVEGCEHEIWTWSGRLTLGASTPLSDLQSQANPQVKEPSYEKSDSVNQSTSIRYWQSSSAFATHRLRFCFLGFGAIGASEYRCYSGGRFGLR